MIKGVANPSSFSTTNDNLASADNSGNTQAICVMTATSNGGNLNGTVYFQFQNSLVTVIGQFYNLNSSGKIYEIYNHSFFF